MSALLEIFSLPNDPARWAALAGALLVALCLPRLLRRKSDLRWLWIGAPLCAAALSALYIQYYLRGGPRIIDATAYFLEASGLSRGLMALPISEPEQAVLGRFLIRTSVDGAAAASVIFPPGYPAFLAVGFWLGAPMAMGPMLAAALVIATMELTRRVVHLGPAKLREHEPQLLVAAAAFSVASATLRYHSADTMAHGLAALCFTVTVAAALASWHSGRAGPAAVAGLAAGWLLATRPVSALALSLCLVALLSWRRPRLRVALTFVLATLPGWLLLSAYQHIATGSWLGSAQHSYYALSDGPPGCFRYGFGAAIGCLGEHGNFVRHNLPSGYGIGAAIATSGRRLLMHVSDPLNFAPLFALVLLGGSRSFGRLVGGRVLTVALGAQLLCYAPFYFDGNYPGGGARMLADVLPLEHVLASFGLLSLCRAARDQNIGLGRSARWCSIDLPLRTLTGWTIAISLLGFAFHTGKHHQLLRDREGGRPMFEPTALAAATARSIDGQAPTKGVLLLDTDHGFNLAYAHAPRGFVVARARGDDLDRLLWESRGRPPLFRYRYRYGDGEAARVAVERLLLDPQPTRETSLMIEGESLWPPRQQRGGWAWPSHDPASCVSGGRVLLLTPTGPQPRVSVQLWGQFLAGRTMSARLRKYGKSNTILRILADGALLATLRPKSPEIDGCEPLGPIALPQLLRKLTLQLDSDQPVGLDSLHFAALVPRKKR